MCNNFEYNNYTQLMDKFMLKKDADKLKKKLKQQANIAKMCEGFDVQYFNIKLNANDALIYTDPLTIGLCNMHTEDFRYTKPVMA